MRVSGKCLLLFYCAFDSCRLQRAGPSACGGVIGSAPATSPHSAGSLVGLRPSEGFESCAPEIQQRLAVVSLKKAEQETEVVDLDFSHSLSIFFSLSDR